MNEWYGFWNWFDSLDIFPFQLVVFAFGICGCCWVHGWVVRHRDATKNMDLVREYVLDIMEDRKSDDKTKLLAIHKLLDLEELENQRSEKYHCLDVYMT